MLPRLVPPDQLAGAGALSSLVSTVATVAGPAAGGLLLALGGPATAYGVDVASFAASLVVLAMMAPLPPSTERTVSTHAFLLEGLRYAASRRDLLGTYLVDLSAMFFAYPVALFPFIAARLHASWAIGLLYTAPFVGALIATASSGWTRHVHRHGRAIVVAAVLWGLSIAAFGLSSRLWVALAFLVLSGFADSVSGLFRSLVWNLSVPDELRGRLAGTELLSFSVGPQLGQVRSSVIAHLTSLRVSLVSGGVACVVSAGALAVALPALWGFDERVDVPPSRRRSTPSS
jgi:predicted MFS family arabinose efflux permease